MALAGLQGGGFWSGDHSCDESPEKSCTLLPCVVERAGRSRGSWTACPAKCRHADEAVRAAVTGVRPCGRTISDSDFDHLAVVLILESKRAQVAQGGTVAALIGWLAGIGNE